MGRCKELPLGTYTQFLFVHMQFYFLNDAKSKSGASGYVGQLCVLIKTRNISLKNKKSFFFLFGCRTLEQKSGRVCALEWAHSRRSATEEPQRWTAAAVPEKVSHFNVFE